MKDTPRPFARLPLLLAVLAGAWTVGDGSLEGRAVEIVSFFEMLGEVPTWFQLTVDPDGLVPSVAMRAQGHFMEDLYHDFDAPLTVGPPAVSG